MRGEHGNRGKIKSESDRRPYGVFTVANGIIVYLQLIFRSESICSDNMKTNQKKVDEAAVKRRYASRDSTSINEVFMIGSFMYLIRI